MPEGRPRWRCTMPRARPWVSRQRLQVQAGAASSALTYNLCSFAGGQDRLVEPSQTD